MSRIHHPVCFFGALSSPEGSVGEGTLWEAASASDDAAYASPYGDHWYSQPWYYSGGNEGCASPACGCGVH